MKFNKKIIGKYQSQNNKKMILWEFWEDGKRHIFNLFLIGYKPNLKDGGFYSLSTLKKIKGNNIKIKELLK